ncbi:MAG: hypothetical protein ABIM20_07835 [candidate division WOR-3 bacterium]
MWYTSLTKDHKISGEAFASPFIMLLLIGLILIIVGYVILFTVPSDGTYERLMTQAFLGMGISIVGAVLLMIYVYKRSK